MFQNLIQKQYSPNKKDIENEDLKKLSKRLIGKSDKETLTNILEWQERNIQPWIDRWYMFSLLYILLIVSFYFLPISYPIKMIMILVFIIMALFNLTQILSFSIPILSYLIALSVWAFSVNPNMEKIFPLSQLIILSILFGGLLFLLLYLMIKYRSIKLKYPEFKLEDTFKLSLPVDKILKYRLAVCRDYAKLTACLLLNSYPKNKIYFFLIPHHVASGIEINGKIYILDQKLPVSIPIKWLEYWKYRMKKKKIEVKTFELIAKDYNTELIKVDLKKLFQEKPLKEDMRKLTNETAKTLNIEQYTKKKEADFIFPLKNYNILYDENELTLFSLVRAIKNKLHDELSGNLINISKIDIGENKTDLILNVYMKV